MIVQNGIRQNVNGQNRMSCDWSNMKRRTHITCPEDALKRRSQTIGAEDMRRRYALYYKNVLILIFHIFFAVLIFCM